MHSMCVPEGGLVLTINLMAPRISVLLLNFSCIGILSTSNHMPCTKFTTNFVGCLCKLTLSGCMKWELILTTTPMGAIVIFIFSCDQAALQMVFSVRPSVRMSVRPSVCLSVTPFSPCSHHRIIMKFSGVITMVKSDVHAKGQGQRSKVKVTEVNTQLSRFRTLTPVWIHIWQWNHAHSWKQHRRGALLIFKVIR